MAGWRQASNRGCDGVGDAGGSDQFLLGEFGAEVAIVAPVDSDEASPWRDGALHTAFTEPTKTTGPVGCCVGEPPTGSMLIASVAPSRRSGGSAPSLSSPSGGMTPSDRGRVAPGAIAHSSKARSAGGADPVTARTSNPWRSAVATQLA